MSRREQRPYPAPRRGLAPCRLRGHRGRLRAIRAHHPRPPPRRPVRLRARAGGRRARRAARAAVRPRRVGRLAPRMLLRVTHAFVTHTHMDHFAGFDHLLALGLGRVPPARAVGRPGLRRPGRAQAARLHLERRAALRGADDDRGARARRDGTRIHARFESARASRAVDAAAARQPARDDDAAARRAAVSRARRDRRPRDAGARVRDRREGAGARGRRPHRRDGPGDRRLAAHAEAGGARRRARRHADRPRLARPRRRPRRAAHRRRAAPAGARHRAGPPHRLRHRPALHAGERRAARARCSPTSTCSTSNRCSSTPSATMRCARTT